MDMLIYIIQNDIRIYRRNRSKFIAGTHSLVDVAGALGQGAPLHAAGVVRYTNDAVCWGGVLVQAASLGAPWWAWHA
jgi:hypothetical protein